MIIIDFVSSKYGDISTVRGEILQNFVFFFANVHGYGLPGSFKDISSLLYANFLNIGENTGYWRKHYLKMSCKFWNEEDLYLLI